MRPRGRAAGARAATRLALRALRPSPRCPRDPAPGAGPRTGPGSRVVGVAFPGALPGSPISLQDLPGDGAGVPRLTRVPTLRVPRSRSRLLPAAGSGGLPCSLLSQTPVDVECLLSPCGHLSAAPIRAVALTLAVWAPLIDRNPLAFSLCTMEQSL